NPSPTRTYFFLFFSIGAAQRQTGIRVPQRECSNTEVATSKGRSPEMSGGIRDGISLTVNQTNLQAKRVYAIKAADIDAIQIGCRAWTVECINAANFTKVVQRNFSVELVRRQILLTSQ